MELVETAKSFLERLEDVQDLTSNRVSINLDVLSKLISTMSFYGDEDTLKALMCEVIEAKRQCTKSIAKEIVIEEKEGKSETSSKRRKMIYDTKNLLDNAEIGFLIGIGSYRELQAIEIERLKEACSELEMPFEDALEMMHNLRQSKGYKEREVKPIVLRTNIVGEA